MGKLNSSFLRVRLFELWDGDPRWAKPIGRVVLDVKRPGLKIWFLLANEFGGFDDFQLKAVE